MWHYLNLSQVVNEASSLSLEEIIASHTELQSDEASLKEINGRIRSEASQAALTCKLGGEHYSRNEFFPPANPYVMHVKG